MISGLYPLGRTLYEAFISATQPHNPPVAFVRRPSCPLTERECDFPARYSGRELHLTRSGPKTETTETTRDLGPISGGRQIRGLSLIRNGDIGLRDTETRNLLRGLGIKRKKPRLGPLGFPLTPGSLLISRRGFELRGQDSNL